MVSVDYLEQERIKIWAEITDIKERLEKKTPDYEKEARSASKRASEFKSRALESKKLVDEILSNLHETTSTLASQKEESARSFESIVRYEAEIQSTLDIVSKAEEKAFAVYSLFEGQEQLSQKIASLQEISSSCDDKLSKINAALNNVTKRKGEFDTIYYEVMGYEQVDEDSGETEAIEGLKDKLDQAYEKLKVDLDKTKKEIANYQVKAEGDYKKLLKKKQIISINRCLIGRSNTTKYYLRLDLCFLMRSLQALALLIRINGKVKLSKEKDLKNRSISQ